MPYNLAILIKSFEDIGCTVKSNGTKIFIVDEWEVNAQSPWCTNVVTGKKINISDLKFLKRKEHSTH